MPGPFKFAWAGGTITDQQTVVTNGTTHGGKIESITIVGDIDNGSSVIDNIASNSGLSAGDLYLISGPGVDGLYFLYDTSKLTPEGSINLSDAATETLRSATFSAIKAISVGATAATFTDGSASIGITGDYPAGIYSVYGPVIGETDDPDGGVMSAPVAVIEYAGGGTASMFIFGPSGPQAVRSTTTGTFPIALIALPDGDWYSITGIPSGALASLYDGLTYNIAGTGIQVGSTFVANHSATEIAVDLPCTATAAALLTITGPRTPNADFDPELHNREDEQLLDIEISQDEGGFATLRVSIRNPNLGLLAFGRNLWCWLSFDQAWTPDEDAEPDLVPLFNGRLIGVPRLAAGEVIELEFLARPDDFNAQKSDLAETLRVLPYYDPVWLTSGSDTPDAVLEAYSALWHIDRITLEVTVSDILQGEDGTINIGEDQAFYDAFSLSYGSPPLTAVSVSGTVKWEQKAEGSMDITQKIVNGFSAAGSPYKSAFGLTLPSHNKFRYFAPTNGGGLISCLCGDGLRTDWPKPGTSLGGGWTLSSDNEGDGRPLCYCISATAPEGWMQPNKLYISYAGAQPLDDQTGKTEDQSNVAVVTQKFGLTYASFPINIYKVRMVLDWRASRERTETVAAVITANVQRQLSDSSDSDREEIALTSEYVAQTVDPGGQIPIGNVARRSYFQSDRGMRSFEYLLLLASAKIRSRARSVNVTFAVAWDVAIDIGLRNSVTLLDRRLPGGTCTGKVKSYKLSVRDGVMFGEFTIGCSIGNDDMPTAAEGVPSYVDDGYTDNYQVFSGSQTTLASGQIAYETLDDFVITDDGLDLTNLTVDQAFDSFTVVNGLEHQMRTLQGFQGIVGNTANGDPATAMAQMMTACTLNMRPVSGTNFHTDFYPSVSQLWLPKTIDLAASE